MPWLATAAGLEHEARSRPARAKRRTWVAREDDTVIGWCEAELAWSTHSEDTADVWVFVRGDRRGRGLGAKLYELGERHLLGVGARELRTVVPDESGVRFAERLGFVRTREEVPSAVDPRTVDTSRLDALVEDLARQGFRLVPLAEAERRPHELHALYAAAAADMPEDHPETNIPYEEWVTETLGKPDLSRAGSFVFVHDERPVSLSFVDVDPVRALAEQELTGTAPDFRRRGLARAAKLSVVRWCAQQGIERLATSNDGENAGMLAINRELGFEPSQSWFSYIRRV
jgi:GNAT superfamily N-acetyltransferase